MCRKLRLKTEHDAQVALVGAVIKRNKGNRKRQECRYYFCDHCQAWHLTSMPKWEPREETG